LQPRLHIEARKDNSSRRGHRGEASEGALVNRKIGKGAASAKRELATEPVQADRFSRARSARSASMLEDYTELIADLIAANG
jgi:hypothetical protein